MRQEDREYLLYRRLNVSEAVGQLAGRLRQVGMLDAARLLLADRSARAEVSIPACTPLPPVPLTYGEEGSPALASIYAPTMSGALGRSAWEAAAYEVLGWSKPGRWVKVINRLPGEVRQWFWLCTGHQGQSMRERPVMALLGLGTTRSRDAWDFHSGGVSFKSPVTGDPVVARGTTLTDFLGRRKAVPAETVWVDPDVLPKYLGAPEGSALRALLEQALFVSDRHTLYLARALELGGVPLTEVAKLLKVAEPIEAEPSTPIPVEPVTPVRKKQDPYKPLHVLLGIAPTVSVPLAPLTDQVSPEELNAMPKQATCLIDVAGLYRDVVERRKVLTSGQFRRAVCAKVPLCDWLLQNEVPVSTLRVWMSRFGGE